MHHVTRNRTCIGKSRSDTARRRASRKRVSLITLIHIDAFCRYDAIGRNALDNALQGYNACIFAYGQTGSGKTYTMMGTPDDPGIVRRLCCDLFNHVKEKTTAIMSFSVEVSYLELYNEQAFDLLKTGPGRGPLRRRNHK